MRALVQRVSQAAVDVEGERVARIGPGMLVLLGVSVEDTEAVADRLALPEGDWRPFERSALRSFVYPDPRRDTAMA